MRINTDHFSTMEELIKTCKMWIVDDDYDAYYRFFDFNCMKELINLIVSDKQVNEKLGE